MQAIDGGSIQSGGMMAMKDSGNTMAIAQGSVKPHKKAWFILPQTRKRNFQSSNLAKLISLEDFVIITDIRHAEICHNTHISVLTPSLRTSVSRNLSQGQYVLLVCPSPVTYPLSLHAKSSP
jgi:hypothetical protein